MFVSLSFRLVVNVESLNGVETVGNLSRHRTAPIVIPLSKTSGGSYTVKYVPAISGEALGHAYQEALVEVAKKMGLPVGLYSSRGEFIKFSEDEYLKEEGISPPKDHSDARRFEVDVILKDIIADVGGFLYTGKHPVKRTSRFQVGYMIPALETAAEASALEAQFHVRFLASRPQRGGEAMLGQIPYNVEVGSALYTFTFTLDLGGIAEPSTKYGNPHPRENDLKNQAKARRQAAIGALTLMTSSWLFGAKRSRFLPNAELRSAVASISTIPFVVSQGNYGTYIADTAKRAENLLSVLKSFGRSEEISILAVDREGLEIPQNVSKASSVEEMIRRISETLKQKNLV
ncbi:MAG TPA: type I-A CRISPR-associated protein Cas7/Csa2 [Sulfolobales archaeon]|nr:type I-A CRISPR-associated protein Cas7/Csa2 [Sulfolobales archaeon]